MQRSKCYADSRRDLDALIQYSTKLSTESEGRPAVDDRLYWGSQLFTKICLHAHSVRRLAPTGLQPSAAGATELWDLASISVLVRTIIDSHLAMDHFAVDAVSPEESEFRFSVWNYHGEYRRLELIRLSGPGGEEERDLENVVAEMKRRVESHPLLQSLPSPRRREILDGKNATPFTRSELATRAGISESYYRMVYDYLSSYVHAYPLSLSQIARARGGDPETLSVISTILDFCCAFLSCSIRGFQAVLSGAGITVSTDESAERIVLGWTQMLENWAERSRSEA